VRDALAATDIQEIQGSVDAAEAKRLLGRFGEIEFAPGDKRPAVDDRHAHIAAVVAQGDERAARQCLVGDTHRAARERSSAREAAAASVPRDLDGAVDVQPTEPAARGQVVAVAGEAQAYRLATEPARHVPQPEPAVGAGASASERPPAMTAERLERDDLPREPRSMAC
jgi:hypothetical protein